MDLLVAVQILAAGMAAGAINTLVGSGTLITFPVLLALGYPPVVANASNTVGLIPGSLAGAWAYRAELATQRHLLTRMGATALVGGVTGAVLLLVLPAEAFRAIVPALIAIALVLVVAQPWLARFLKTRREQRAETRQPGPPANAGFGTQRGAGSGPQNGAGSGPQNGTGSGPQNGADGSEPSAPADRSGLLLTVGVFGTSVYGGYFGAAQGVLLLGILGLLVPATLQQLNGVKNIFVALVNAVSAAIFVVAGAVAWAPAGLIAAGSIVGSLVAGRYGRRLPDPALRTVIVVVGLIAVVTMIVR